MLETTNVVQLCASGIVVIKYINHLIVIKLWVVGDELTSLNSEESDNRFPTPGIGSQLCECFNHMKLALHVTDSGI